MRDMFHAKSVVAAHLNLQSRLRAVSAFPDSLLQYRLRPLAPNHVEQRQPRSFGFSLALRFRALSQQSSYKLNNSRNRRVCARLTGISVCRLSSMRS